MKYCSDTTRQHDCFLKYPSCGVNIRQIIQQEGGKGLPFPTEDNLVINLDQVETCIARKLQRSQNATMDIALGISNSLRNRQMLLVELKLRVNSVINLKKDELVDKVNGSVSILKHNCPIAKKYLFIFNKSKTAEATRHIARLFNNRPDSPYVVKSEGDLYNDYWNV